MASMGLHDDPEARLQLPEVGGHDDVHKRPAPLVPMQHLQAGQNCSLPSSRALCDGAIAGSRQVAACLSSCSAQERQQCGHAPLPVPSFGNRQIARCSVVKRLQLSCLIWPQRAKHTPSAQDPKGLRTTFMHA